MTVYELYEKLNIKIPSSLSCEWDNDGLMCCPRPQCDVSRVMICLDVTAEVVDVAVREGYDVIISHHPLIFKGLKNLSGEDCVSRKAMELVAEGVAVFSFHTRLDAVSGGVNDTLSAILGIKDVSPFGEDSIGRVGTLEAPCEPDVFAAHVKERLGVDFVRYSKGSEMCHRVAVLGGEGGDDIAQAKAAGADTFVSGRLGYHNMTDAPQMGITLIEAGHFYTENPICKVIKGMVEGIDPNISCDIFYSNVIRSV